MKGDSPLFSNGKKNTSNYSSNNTAVNNEPSPLKDSSPKEMSPTGKSLLESAQTEEVKDLVKQLYRPGAEIGDGGTADALKHEKETGQLVGNKGHEQKAKERAAQIKKMLSKNPNHVDKDLLQKLLKALEDALNGGK